MAEELGKIERPSVDTFQGGRKLYIVSLIFAGTEAPQEFREKCERYWQQVSEHISSQESKVGKISRIFHESIALSGEDGLKVMEHWNQQSYQIIKDKMENGAVLEATELADLTDECMDWERCLLLGFFSRKVAGIIADNYRISAKQRYEYIGQRLNEALKPEEVGLLFIRDGHSVQFPNDMHVFTIAPPALDEIHRWLRDRSRTEEEKSVEPEEPEQSQS